MKFKCYIMLIWLTSLLSVTFAESIRIRTSKTTFLPYEPIYLMIQYRGTKNIALSPDFKEIEIVINAKGFSAIR